MNFDFDWLANWKTVVNVAITALIFGSLGSLVVYLASPDGTVWHAKSVLAGGFVPVIAAIKERFTRSPADAAK